MDIRSCDASNNCLNFSGSSISGAAPPKRLFDRYNELPPKRNSPSLIHTCNKVESFVESSGVTDFLKSETLEKEDIFSVIGEVTECSLPSLFQDVFMDNESFPTGIDKPK